MVLVLHRRGDNPQDQTPCRSRTAIDEGDIRPFSSRSSESEGREFESVSGAPLSRTIVVKRFHETNRIERSNSTLGPHPEEAALLARPSRRMAVGTISFVAVLRDARILRQALRSALLRMRLMDDIDMIRTMKSLR